MQVHNITIPHFGAAVPGHGGYFAGLQRGPTIDGIQQPPVALIVADRAHHGTTTWGVYGRKIEGCASTTDGQSNTLAMLADDCPAAKHVRALVVEGHDDYFLPAIGQLNTIATNAPELVEPKADAWSSTQFSSDGAIVQDFEYGSSGWGFKGSEFLVVPVRVIQLHTLSASAL